MTHPSALLPEVLLKRAGETPTRRALLQKIRGKWSETTWHGYAQAVAEVAEGLHGLGVKAGELVLMIVDNRPAFAYLDVATQSIGAVSVPVVPTTRPEDVSHLIMRLKPAVIVVQDTTWVEVVLRDAGATCKIVHVDTAGIAAYQDDRLIAYQGLRESGAKSANVMELFRSRVAALRAEDIATLSVSSGTHGVLRTFSFTAKQVGESARVMAARFPLNAGEFVLSFAPLAATAERSITLYPSILTGAVVAFPENATVAAAAATEIEPHFVHIPAAELGELSALSFRRLERNKGLKKLFARGSLKAMVNGSATSALGHGLVGRFIIRQFGLNKSRTLLVSGTSVSGSVGHFLTALRLPFLDAYTISASLTPVMIATSPGGSYGEVLDGAEVELSPVGQLRIRGSLISASAIESSGWYETSDHGIKDQADVAILGPTALHGVVREVRALEQAVSTSKYVNRAIVLPLGDNAAGLFLQVEPEALSNWARREGISFTTVSAIVENRLAQELLAREVSPVLERLALREKIHRVIVGRSTLTVDSGELTVTGKARRQEISARQGDIRMELSEFTAS